MAAATAAGQRGVALSNRFPGIYQTQKTLLFQSAVWVLWVETEVLAMSEYVYSQSGLKDIVLPLLQKYPVEQAILFSSYARDESTASSDINLVIVEGAAFDPTDGSALRTNCTLPQRRRWTYMSCGRSMLGQTFIIRFWMKGYRSHEIQ